MNQTFFDLNDELRDTGMPTCTHDDAMHCLRDALLDSVTSHLVADVPVGVFLSAGLDSTTVTALAVEVEGSVLHTLTLGFNEYLGTSHDEVPLAEIVAKHYATSHLTCRVTRQDFSAEFDQVMEAMDQPSIDGINTYFVAKAAREMGFKVALSGLGGDELFGGYSDFQDIPQLVRALKPFGWFPELGRCFRLITARSDQAAYITQVRQSFRIRWRLVRCVSLTAGPFHALGASQNT